MLTSAASPVPLTGEAGPPLRVLFIAPFERGRGHGGSQRATAIAERLEARGATVRWHVAPMGSAPRAAKVRAALAGRPTLVLLHDDAPPPPADSYDVVLAVHSYLEPQLDKVATVRLRVVDFQDVQWQHLRDGSRCENVAARLWAAWQVRLMRAFEQRIVRERPLVLFSSLEELAWAASVGGTDHALFLPNVLPQAFVTEALEVANARRTRGVGGARLVYMGTLEFPPNMSSLLRFLAQDWPLVRERLPDAKLTIIGRCSEADRRAFDEHPGVTALGFVSDPRGHLISASAAILPFDGTAGSSLRILYYALAEVPLIGSKGAFRGIPFSAGVVAGGRKGWAEAISRCLTADNDSLLETARNGARALQEDRAPWDTAWAALHPPPGPLS